MALIVEDGTGKATANSYVSLAVADAYFLLRGNADWAGPDTEKEVETLTIASACAVSGDLTITLNDVAFTVAVTTAADTAAKVATAIRAASYAGWVATGADEDIIFTAGTAETRAGAYAIAVGATGVTGTYA